ncbi:MAG: ATP-dependent protease subunit HslV [Candidatus Neomarinimicrobiota bacterium]
MKKKIRSTTIIGVRNKGKVAMAGDGQVTFGDMAFKQKAVKVREFKVAQNKVLGGFAGAAADALTLFEKFEQKLEQYEGDLARATVELAKEWRMDKMLRHLDAMLVVMDSKNSFIIAGDGNVIEPDGQIIAIGSGGGFAQAAAKALLTQKTLSAKKIASDSLKIAAELCIYTNDSISVLEI